MIDRILLRSAPAALALACFVGGGAALAQGPTEPVEIVVGSGPGGGYDRMARAIESVLEGKNLIDVPINITYEPGGGGAVGWAKISKQSRGPTKLSIFSPNLVTNEVLGTAPLSFEDLTMIATLVFEDGCFAVNPTGNLKTAEDLVNALKTSPESIRFGFAVAAGNQWHVAMAKLADAVGADVTKIRATVFDAAAKSVAALLGNHVDVSVSGCASFAKYHESGDLQIVAVASPERQAAPLDGVPTWQELGQDVVWSAWRGILGPKSMKPEEIAFWGEVLQKVVEDESWKPIEQENYWRTEFLGSEKTSAMLRSERDQYTTTIKQLGLIQ
ncbi:Bug family tripartite tricarboxylate transporter substrate binding protein [Faunimonas sp. B44]|uniref:Bug family tripartite tricarboxylate transporter substrate binding protein n=1 Tax=Faunimonas sp. B44 TaxID=3461493 RepID=UPI004044B96A